jgi:hypothetical protein
MMPEIPSFLNRLDFIDTLLPGYVTILAYLIVFRPDVLFSEKAFSFDIFSSVVFIVAGPALGLTLAQLHRSAFSIYSKIRPPHDEAYVNRYVKIRLKMAPAERLELDESEAVYDFCVSTGLALLGLAVLGFFKFFSSLGLQSLFLCVGGILLLIGAYFQWSESYSPIMEELARKYK